MNPRRVWAMARKEFFHVIRDRRSLIMGIAIPILMLILYGYALSLDVDNVPMVIWDQSMSSVSREFITKFIGSRYFSLHKYIENYNEVEKSIDSRQALMALIIPNDFDNLIKSGRQTQIQLIVDGSDSNTATIAMGYANIIVQTFSQELAIQFIRKRGGRIPRTPLDLRPRVWFNPDLESKNFIIPGLIAVIMMVIAALLTSLTVAREWECGTMEQLISTPVKSHEMILGKIIPYFIIGIFDVFIAVLMGEFLFKVPLRGNGALIFGMTAIFLAGTLSMGLLISIIAKNQLIANQMAMIITFLPSFLLSGFVYAIYNMPKFLQILTYLIPARYFVTILKGIYLKGVGLNILWFETLLLSIFGVAMIILANVKLKKKLE